jgi:3-hydroxyisobutyrate dehydrogenase-like beta-hydroxyacid dehydrogenase
MDRVGIIGLGKMGLPIARNLAQAGGTWTSPACTTS